MRPQRGGCSADLLGCCVLLVLLAVAGFAVGVAVASGSTLVQRMVGR